MSFQIDGQSGFHQLYQCPECQETIWPDELTNIDDELWFCPACGFGGLREEFE